MNFMLHYAAAVGLTIIVMGSYRSASQPWARALLRTMRTPILEGGLLGQEESSSERICLTLDIGEVTRPDTCKHVVIQNYD